MMHCQKNIKLRMCIICIFNQWPVLIQDQVMAEVVEFKPWWQDDLTTKMWAGFLTTHRLSCVPRKMMQFD